MNFRTIDNRVALLVRGTALVLLLWMSGFAMAQEKYDTQCGRLDTTDSQDAFQAEAFLADMEKWTQLERVRAEKTYIALGASSSTSKLAPISTKDATVKSDQPVTSKPLAEKPPLKTAPSSQIELSQNAKMIVGMLHAQAKPMVGQFHSQNPGRPEVVVTQIANYLVGKNSKLHPEIATAAARSVFLDHLRNSATAARTAMRTNFDGFACLSKYDRDVGAGIDGEYDVEQRLAEVGAARRHLSRWSPGIKFGENDSVDLTWLIGSMEDAIEVAHDARIDLIRVESFLRSIYARRSRYEEKISSTAITDAWRAVNGSWFINQSSLSAQGIDLGLREMNQALADLRDLPLRGERDEEELEEIQHTLTIFAYGVSLVNDALNAAHGALLDGRRLAGAIHDGGSQYRRMIRDEADQYRRMARAAQQRVYPLWQDADGARTN